jgi:hypothetical protein
MRYGHSLTAHRKDPFRLLGIVLVRDRHPEERHDAVAGMLIHHPLEAAHARGVDLEETIEGRVSVDFVGAEKAFDGYTVTVEDTRYAYDENRFISFGILRGSRRSHRPHRA